MGQVNLQGTLLAGPPGAGGTFPTVSLNEQLSLYINPKSYNAATGILQRQIASPNAFVVLPTVGSTADVTKGDTLYFKSDGPVILRLIQDDGTGNGTVQIDMPVTGLVIHEFPGTQPLLGLSVKGTARFVYFVSGPA